MSPEPRPLTTHQFRLGSLVPDGGHGNMPNRAWRDIFPLYFHRLPLADVDALARRSRYRLDTRRRILPTLQRYDLRERLPELVLCRRETE